MADVIATSPVFASTDGLRELWDVVAEVDAGTALLNEDRAGVAYTPSGGFTGTDVVGPLTVSGIELGGEGLKLLQASVATDGTYEFAVTGATAATKNGTKVYAVMGTGGAATRIVELTLTPTGNKLFGVVNGPQGYVPSAAKTPVKIGV